MRKAGNEILRSPSVDKLRHSHPNHPIAHESASTREKLRNPDSINLSILDSQRALNYSGLNEKFSKNLANFRPLQRRILLQSPQHA